MQADLGRLTHNSALKIGLRDLLFRSRDHLRRSVHQLFAFPNLEQRRDATFFPRSDQLQRLFAAGQRASGDLELHVALEQVEVGPGDISDHCGDHRLAIVVAGEELSPRGLRCAS